jgi:hypothetical protein
LNIKNKKCHKDKNIKKIKKKKKIYEQKEKLQPFNTKKELHWISIRIGRAKRVFDLE